MACTICTASEASATVTLVEEEITHGRIWSKRADLGAWQLCDDCHARVLGIAHRAGGGARRAGPVLRLVTPSYQPGASASCEYCEIELPFRSVAFEATSVQQPDDEPSVPFCQRICRACGSWWQTIMQSPLYLAGSDRRGVEGLPGIWLGGRAVVAADVNLVERDSLTLERAIEEMGGLLVKGDVDEAEIIFVRADEHFAATRFVRGYPDLAGRVVLVAAESGLPDLSRALRAGSHGAIAEPLSPAQVAGAIDRMDRRWPAYRDPDTGLPLLDASTPTSFAGMPATDIALPGSNASPVETFLALRRSVRGYDYVGLRGDLVAARVFAEPHHVPAVVDQVTELFGTAPESFPVEHRLETVAPIPNYAYHAIGAPSRKDVPRADILLLEDNDGDANIVIEALEQAMVKRRIGIHHVWNGRDGMQFLRKQGPFSSAPTPDLVLLDLNLPIMNGHEALRDLRSDPWLFRMPVVVLSGSSARADILDSYASHANSYVVKPALFQEWVELVREITTFWLDFASLPGAKPAARAA